MNPESELVRRPSTGHQANNMIDVLAEMKRSGSKHFVKSLPRTAFYDPIVRQAAQLAMPSKFVRENWKKIEQWVILRAYPSYGRLATRPWIVHLSIRKSPSGTPIVQMVGGWPAFVVGNRLEQGDHLIFHLKEDARSEFEVYMFRGPSGSPYFPSGGESVPDSEERGNGSDSDDDEEEDVSDSEEEEEDPNNLPRLPSPVHQQEEPNQGFSRDSREENPAPIQATGNPRVYPSFSKKLTISNIRGPASGGCSGKFDLPRRFVRTHGEQVLDLVKLQGIHADSPTHLITCRRTPGDLLKVYFIRSGWSRFVRENGLKEGDELQFSFMATSYFVVRKIS